MWVNAMGDIKKIAALKVKPYEQVERSDLQESQSSSDWSDDDEGWSLKDYVVENVEDGVNDDAEEDSIGAKYLKMENSECFGESSVFVVELLVSEHKCPEVVEAKKK